MRMSLHAGVGYDFLCAAPFVFKKRQELLLVSKHNFLMFFFLCSNYVYVCGLVWIHAHEAQSSKVSHSLELQLKVVVSCVTWMSVLETKLGSLEIQYKLFNH